MGCWFELCTGQFAHFMGLVGIAAEITTPFINLRWFLAESDMKSGRLYIINGMLIVVLWFIFRICGFAFLGVRIFEQRQDIYAMSWDKQMTVALTYVVGYGLQFFWFWKICRGALKAL